MNRLTLKLNSGANTGGREYSRTFYWHAIAVKCTEPLLTYYSLY